MSLHDEIINIKSIIPNGIKSGREIMMYRTGHRDARHGAAELAIEYDQKIEHLQELNKELFNRLSKTLTCIELSNDCFGDMDAMRRIIERYQNEK